MSGYGSAAAAVFLRDFRLWKSYRARWITTVFTALAGTTLFYYISRLVNSEAVGSADEYFGFVVVGTVILEVLTSTLSAPVATLRSELLTGNFERMVVSPFGPIAAISAMMMFPIVLGLAVGVITVGFATLAFGLAIQFPGLLLTIPVALLGTLAFAPFGVAIGTLTLTFKGTNAGAALIITVLSIVGGLYFPTSLLPDWIQWARDVQPFTPAADLLRNTLVGTPLPVPALDLVLRLAGFAILAGPIALAVLATAIRYARRNGTITEY